MAGFKIPSLSDTRDFFVAVFKALFPDRNVGAARSYHARRATFVAAAVTQLHAHVDAVQNDVMPDTAGDDGGIDRWGGIVGTERKAATGATKSAAGRVRGTPGTAINVGTQLKHPSSGLIFQVATSTVMPGTSFTDVDVGAVDVGAQTRLAAGEVLQFLATPPGLETNVVLQKALDENGFDAEQFGAYRGRVLSTFSTPTSGGSQGDFVTWALELAGIAAAYCYPNRAGIGTIDVVGLHSGLGAARILTGGEAAALLGWLKTLAPAHLAGALGALRVLTAIADTQNIELTVTANGKAAYAFDWIDSAPPVVLAWTPATRSLQFTANLPSTMKAGHRIVLKGVASAQDGRQYTIEALSAADTVILQTAPIANPAATDIAYSGGPLVDVIRNAIVGHINGQTVYAGKGGQPMPESALASTVGLEVLAEGVGPANPGGVYGTWSGGLIRAVLGKLAIYAAGVRNYNIITPAADYEAIDYAIPNDTQIGLIVPNSIIVRSA